MKTTHKPNELAAARQWIEELFPHTGKAARSSIKAMGYAHPYNERAKDSIVRADALARYVLSTTNAPQLEG